MPKISLILSEKGSVVHQVTQGATVLEAAKIMNDHQCGSLVVMKDDKLVGIITERDVLSRVVAEQRDPASTPVVAVMTHEVAVCGLETKIEEARTVMRNRRIRHLPVVDKDHKLLGMISIGDLNAFRLNGQEQTIHFLHEYLYGETV